MFKSVAIAKILTVPVVLSTCQIYNAEMWSVDSSHLMDVLYLMNIIKTLASRPDLQVGNSKLSAIYFFLLIHNIDQN